MLLFCAKPIVKESRKFELEEEEERHPESVSQQSLFPW